MMKRLQSMKTKTYAFILALGLAHPGYAALVDMAEYQDWEGVQASISTEDINALQADGMSALFWAVYYDQADIVNLLIDAGADANIANRYGLTPLIQAAINGNGEIMSLLVDAGADPNARTLQGDTALMNASKTGALQGIQALLEAGAEVDARDSYTFQTALMWATAFNNADIVSTLIENGADVNARSAELIFSGVQQGGVAGDQPNGGLTSVHHAARENAIEALEVLLAAGADPDILDPQGISPLRVAITNENWDLAKVLIESGANLNDGALVDLMEAPYKKFAWQHAAKNYEDKTNVEELTALMIEMGVDIDAVVEGAIPYFSTGFVGDKGTEGQTALYNAALGDRTETIAMLLEHGANPNSLNKGNTPLAALFNVYTGFRPPNPANGDIVVEEPTFEEKMVIADMLFEHGADVNTTVGTGGNILHQAAAFGEDEVVEYLIEKGVDLSKKDDSGRTALDVASGIPAVGGEACARPGSPECRSETPPELPVYESTIAILTEAMNAQGIAIEEYVAPPSEEESGEA